jgi:hypothetical protein
MEIAMIEDRAAAQADVVAKLSRESVTGTLRPTLDGIYRQMTTRERLGSVSCGTRLSMLWTGCVGKR